MDISKKKNTEKNKVKVIERTIKIINLLENTSKGIGLTEISKRTNINKTTCYRILQTLMSDNIVEYGETNGSYRLGLRLLELGNSVLKRMDVREIALPYLNELTAITKQTSYLCVLHQDKALCVERVEGSHLQILMLKVGDIWPLYVGAAPRAMLAYLDDVKIEEIISNATDEHTKLSEKKHNNYWQLIYDIREKGYSVSYEDVIPNVSSIGAPIFDHRGKVIAAISVSSTAPGSLYEKEKKISSLVVGAANKISKQLGWWN